MATFSNSQQKAEIIRYLGGGVQVGRIHARWQQKRKPAFFDEGFLQPSITTVGVLPIHSDGKKVDKGEA